MKPPRLVALDVHYSGDRAVGAGITFSAWDSSVEEEKYVVRLENIAD